MRPSASRPIALGRKNFTGFGARGWRAAIETPNSTAAWPRPHEIQAGLTGRSSRDRRTSLARRSAAVGSFYLVFFAPASTEQFPWSLGCEFSQVVIDCVSEADILLLMQSQ